jgi:hypothetical protein
MRHRQLSDFDPGTLIGASIANTGHAEAHKFELVAASVPDNAIADGPSPGEREDHGERVERINEPNARVDELSTSSSITSFSSSISDSPSTDEPYAREDTCIVPCDPDRLSSQQHAEREWVGQHARCFLLPADGPDDKPSSPGTAQGECPSPGGHSEHANKRSVRVDDDSSSSSSISCHSPSINSRKHEREVEHVLQ